MRKLPEPVRKIIGDLSDTERVLVGLDLRPRAAEGAREAQESFDDHKAFEKALAAQPEADALPSAAVRHRHHPRSARAIQNIRAICEEKLRADTTSK